MTSRTSSRSTLARPACSRCAAATGRSGAIATGAAASSTARAAPAARCPSTSRKPGRPSRSTLRATASWTSA
eukprot:5895034-Lingulodinium_polyedra.AAC.1